MPSKRFGNVYIPKLYGTRFVHMGWHIVFAPPYMIEISTNNSYVIVQFFQKYFVTFIQVYCFRISKKISKVTKDGTSRNVYQTNFPIQLKLKLLVEYKLPPDFSITNL